MSYGSSQFPIEKYPTSYVVFDLETTGLSCESDGILQIGAIRIVDGLEEQSFATYVDTDVPLSPEAQRVNGITRSMVSGSPKTDEAIRRFIDFVGDFPIVGYNSDSFDVPMLQSNARRHGVKLPEWKAFDCMSVAKSMFGYRRKLKDLCHDYGISPGGHDALADARATWLCLEAMRKNIIATTERAAVFGTPHDGPLTGCSIVFTGRFQSPSVHDLMMQAHQLGAALQDRVTLKTTHLVVLDNPGDSKIKKAQEYKSRTNVEIVPYDDYAENMVRGLGRQQPFKVVHQDMLELPTNEAAGSTGGSASHSKGSLGDAAGESTNIWPLVKIVLIVALVALAIYALVTWWPIIVAILIVLALLFGKK
ncbi:exonuclease domain-containing protein [Leptogranulimonas caecicola]|uniref:BRCT domain-containing protein n=3 Tax=Leptogranulimonas caecicola TaxID=2894156 RepID=A0AAU9C548_9ACTN|nr:exonuclease domain-containing protein [Leptogranulimonas caecicola]BDC91358.1 hypothetical protein ATTO_12300 [Leptogranulimonas caecicola]